VNPWNSKQPMDLTLSLQDMELLPADPYAGKYLGHRLIKGRLSAQLSYQIRERTLKSSNRLTLDQLTLGQKVASPDASRLPVRLAIAILKDRDGRIALEVPVDGTLDDPQFNLGKVFYRALEKALTGIAASPFAALAALFGGQGEELSFQEFLPGSTHLLPAAIAKLDALANGLSQRPELQLVIEGSADPQTDLAALRRAVLNRKSSAPEWNIGAKPSSAWTNADTTDPLPAGGSPKAFSFEKGSSVLRHRVTDSSPPDASSSTGAGQFLHRVAPIFADDKGATALMMILAPVAGATESDGEAQRLEAVVIAPGALTALAEERARSVRAYLVQTRNIATARITVAPTDGHHQGSRVYLRLQ